MPKQILEGHKHSINNNYDEVSQVKRIKWFQDHFRSWSMVIVAYAILLFEPEFLRICVLLWEECFA